MYLYMHHYTNKNIISVKQFLNNYINEIHFDYIQNLLNKTVENCNILFTQVCYLIELFLLYDYENNKSEYNNNIFNELFIRNCFKLIKKNKINDDIDKELEKNTYKFIHCMIFMNKKFRIK